MPQIPLSSLHAFQTGVVAILLAFIIVEAVVAWRRGQTIHDRKETAANIGVFLGMRVSKVLTLSYGAWIFEAVAPFRLFDFERSVGVFLLTFVVADFVYYLYHRAMHEIPALWCFHLVHHSSHQMNLTTSGRLNWLSPLISPLFYLPLVVVGLPGDFIIAAMGLNLLFQFFLHTELVGRVPLLEGIINTPSAHRVHHGRNERYLDTNYGGVFMIWDRLLGTFVEETEPVRYGVTTGHQGHNPVWLVFGGFVDFARKHRRMGRQANR